MSECSICSEQANFAIPVRDNQGQVVYYEFRCAAHLQDDVQKQKIKRKR